MENTGNIVKRLLYRVREIYKDMQREDLPLNRMQWWKLQSIPTSGMRLEPEGSSEMTGETPYYVDVYLSNIKIGRVYGNRIVIPRGREDITKCGEVRSIVDYVQKKVIPLHKTLEGSLAAEPVVFDE